MNKYEKMGLLSVLIAISSRIVEGPSTHALAFGMIGILLFMFGDIIDSKINKT